MRPPLPYIDFHTHTPSPDPDVLSIVNVDLKIPEGIPSGAHCTLGIHPWDTHLPGLEAHWQQLTELAPAPWVLGIGEVGLDPLRGAPLGQQEALLRRQIELAARVRKPMVIHCVRAWSRLMAIKKGCDSGTPWAVHGFRGGRRLAEQLLGLGLYLSFGAHLLWRPAEAGDALRAVPLNRLLLETDASGASLKAIHAAAAELLGIPPQALIGAVAQNCRAFFRHPLAAG